MPKDSALSTSVAALAAARPVSVISASVARRSSAWGTRRTSPSASSLSMMFVTDVRWTWRRSPILPRGSAPARVKERSISAS